MQQNKNCIDRNLTNMQFKSLNTCGPQRKKQLHTSLQWVKISKSKIFFTIQIIKEYMN